MVSAYDAVLCTAWEERWELMRDVPPRTYKYLEHRMGESSLSGVIWRTRLTCERYQGYAESNMELWRGETDG